MIGWGQYPRFRGFSGILGHMGVAQGVTGVGRRLGSKVPMKESLGASTHYMGGGQNYGPFLDPY